MNPITKKVYGRFDDGLIDVRANAIELVSVHAADTCDFGGFTVRVWGSLDDEDRGGFIVDVYPTGHNGGFIPFVQENDLGFEFHIAGDSEGSTLLEALYQALAAVRRDPRKRVGSVAREVAK